MFFVTSIFFILLVAGLQRPLRRADQAVRLRDEFLSLASHELKTPLTTLLIQAQLRKQKLDRADSQPISTPELQKMATSDLTQLGRLSQLIDNMLDVSRIELSKASFHPIRGDLCQFTREVVDRFSAQAQKYGVQIETEFCKEAAAIFDPLQMEQLLVNLLSNGIKYGRERPVHLSIDQPNPHLARIKVRDEGIGIAPADVERIFAKFERAVPGHEISGLGIGLYVGRNIVERHGGKIEVTSEPGKGSTFTVTLPLVMHSQLGESLGSEPA
jgi:signal transduction histidine kinase